MTAVSDEPWVAPWMKDAACTGHPVSWWFPDNETQWMHQAREALAICHRCPVQAECLQFAIDNDDRHGIFGGTLPHERYALKHNKPLRKDSRWLR